MKNIICFFLVFISFTFTSNVIVASTYGLKPSSGFRISINPGEKYESSLKLFNYTDDSITMNLQSVNATISDRGELLFDDQVEEVFIPKWITFSVADSSKVEIAPHSVLDVNFELDVPRGTPSGMYYGGIGLKSYPKQDVNTIGSAVTTRIVSGVYLHVLGDEVFDFTVDDFIYHYDLFKPTIFNIYSKDLIFDTIYVNDSNIVVDFDANIVVINSKNEIVFTDNYSDIIFSGAKRTFSNHWSKLPYFGKFYVTQNVTYERSKQYGRSLIDSGPITENDTFSFYIIPWGDIILFSIFLFIIIIIYIIRRVLFKRFKKQLSQYLVKESDTLVKLSSYGKYSWKKLAKVNNIKPPYQLEVGTTILVDLSKVQNNLNNVSYEEKK